MTCRQPATLHHQQDLTRVKEGTCWNVLLCLLQHQRPQISVWLLCETGTQTCGHTHTHTHGGLCFVSSANLHISPAWHDRVSAMTSRHGSPPFVMSLQCDSIYQVRPSATQRPHSLKAVVVVTSIVIVVFSRSAARQRRQRRLVTCSGSKEPAGGGSESS